jgi:lipid A disaccharide synthetase
MTNDNFVNSVMPIVPNVVAWRQKKKKHVAGDPDLVIWLMPSTE